MVDIALIIPNAPFLAEPLSFPHLGILYISASLKSAGYKPKVYDLTGGAKLPKINADIVGITATSPLFHSAINIMNEIREYNSDACFVIGGPHATVAPETCVAAGFDVTIVGEGERVMVDIANDLETPRRQIPPVIRAKPINPLDNLPYPDRDAIDMNAYHYYLYGQKCANIQTQRGCSYGCAFCCGRDIESYRWARQRSVEDVRGEIRLLKRKYGIGSLMFFDDEFNLNKKHTLEMCQMLKEEDIIWRAMIRSNLFDEELAKAMAEAGCKELGCVPAGHLIHLKDSMRDIAKVDNTSEVLANDFTEIFQTFQRDYDGAVYRVHGSGLLPFTITEEHPILIAQARVVFSKSHVTKRHTIRKRQIINEIWKRACDLSVKEKRSGRIIGDFLVFPKLKTNRRIKYVEVVYKNQPWKGVKKIPINEETAEFFGYYVAEGSSGGIYLGRHEEVLAKRVQCLIRKYFNYKAEIAKKTTAIAVILASKPFLNFLKANCGKNALEKKIPSWILHNRRKILRSFLKGYFLGDGTTLKDSICLSTVSETLALQLQLALSKFGIFSSVNKNKRDSISKIRNRKINQHDIYRIYVRSNKGVEFFGNVKELHQNHLHMSYLEDKENFYIPILKVEKEHFMGKVYNLRTGSATYRLSNITVHNCGVETGSPTIKKNINKGTTIEQDFKARELCKKYDIKFKCFIVVGLPGENYQTFNETREWIKKAQPDNFDYTILVPYPGSPIWNHPENYDIQFDKEEIIKSHFDDTFYKGETPSGVKSFVSTSALSREEIVRLRMELEKEFPRMISTPWSGTEKHE